MARTKAELKALPSNTEAEACVIAAMLLSRECVEEIVSEAAPDDFYQPSHRVLFTAMREMFERDIPIDSVSLIDYLKSCGKLSKAGGEEAIVDLMGRTISLASWQHHLEIVRRDAMLREIIAASNRINALAFSAPVDIKEVVQQAEGELLGVTGREVRSPFKPLSDYMVEAWNEARVIAEQGAAPGALTGFTSLDRMLNGLRGGQLVVVGARPAVGKTSFALNLAMTMAAQGLTVGFFSLEMSGKEVAQRLICAQSRVSLTDLRAGTLTDEDWASLSRASADLAALDILVDETPGTTLTEIRAKARRMLHNKPRGVIIIDYLQLISPPAGSRADNRAVEVSEMSRGLKVMAKELDVPVIALSQLSRQVESRTGKRPQLSDLRESGSIEQDADIVLFLDRSSSPQEAKREDRPDEGITRLILAKNRSGATGDVDLTFLPASTRFYEISENGI